MEARSSRTGGALWAMARPFRGTFAGTVCGVLVGLLQNVIAPFVGLPPFGSGYEVLSILLGLSLGAMLGDIVAAFFKRRMGLKRGAPLFCHRSA